MKELLEALNMAYLDYFNNYLTIERFAHDHNLDKEFAITLITLGKRINHREYLAYDATVTKDNDTTESIEFTPSQMTVLISLVQLGIDSLDTDLSSVQQSDEIDDLNKIKDKVTNASNRIHKRINNYYEEN